jgi:hypothetical protein
MHAILQNLSLKRTNFGFLPDVASQQAPVWIPHNWNNSNPPCSTAFFNVFYFASIGIEEFAKLHSAAVLYALIPRAFTKNSEIKKP